MSTAQAFLDEMNEAGKEASGGGAGTIAQITVEFGWWRYVEGIEYWDSFVPVPSASDMKNAQQKCIDFLRANESEDWPNFGIRTTVHKEEILTGEKRSYEGDLVKFIEKYKEDSYDIVYQSLSDTKCPVNVKFWGRVKQKNDPYFVKQGEKGKTKKDQNGNPAYPRVRYIAEAFSNRAEALAAAGDNPSVPTLSGPMLSATAIAAKWTIKTLRADSGNLHNAIAGQPIKIVKDILRKWDLEPSDLKLVDIEIPF